jgi:uncharacterized membrane protein
VAQVGLRLFFMGSSVAAGLGLAIIVPSNEALAISNQLEATRRTALIVTSLCGGGLACLAGAAYLLRRRTRMAVEHLRLLALLGSPLLLSFAIPNLFNWLVYQNRDFLFAVVATLFGLALERTVLTSMRAAEQLGLLERLHDPVHRLGRMLRRVPGLLLAAMVIGFAAHMAFYTIRQHDQLMTYSWDLGIFNNLMWNLLRGQWFKAAPVLGPEGSHIQFHATFGAYLLLPIYALWQKPQMLLIIQASLLALAAVPLYLVAQRRLGSPWLGLVFAYVYLIHAPLHGPIFYDFHFLTIAPFFVGWVIYCFETDKRGWLVFAWLAAVSTREEISAGLGVAALYYLLAGRRTRWAWSMGAASAAYFLVVKFYVMPLHGPTEDSFAWIFKDLIPPGEAGFPGVLRTLTTNPVYTFNSMFTSEKFTYLLKTLGPLLLLPIRHSLIWMLCLPAILFTLLATGYPPLIETKFQYTSNWTPYVLFGSVFVLDAWRRRETTRYVAAVPALCITATLFSYNGGAIFQKNSFLGGFHQVSFTWTKAHQKQRDDLYELIAKIPDDASVSACEMIVPHVSSRENAYTLNRSGALDADYLLCDLGLLRIPPAPDFMRAAVATGQYSFMGKSGNFALWGKGGNHEHDMEGRRLIPGMAHSEPPTARPQPSRPPRPFEASQPLVDPGSEHSDAGSANAGDAGASVGRAH